MLSAALLLLANSLFLTLRLTGNPGSFPKPLSAKEEQMYLERSLPGTWRPATSRLSTTFVWLPTL